MEPHVGDIVRLKRTRAVKAQLRGAKIKIVALEPYLKAELLETRKGYRGYRPFAVGDTFGLWADCIAYPLQA